jgi:penicillin amidase
MGRKRLPVIDGELKVEGLTSTVEVIRDRWGIPHIYAADSNDLFFAQGFVHAQDRLWQMELNRRTGRGTLSELFGKMALDTDRVIRTLGWDRLGKADWANFDGQAKDMISAYVKGINAFIENSRSRLPIEFTLLGYKPHPWTEDDVLAFSRVMYWKLSDTWYGKLVRARISLAVGKEHAGELEFEHAEENPLVLPGGIEFNLLNPDKTLKGAKGPFLKRGKGSNAWAVSGGKTATGSPFLCNDMHLEVGIPSLWYEVHLTGGGFNAAGVSLPGLPLVMVGHNDNIAWGMTLAYTDSEDLFIEKFNPDNPAQYQYQGEWKEADVIEESIKVKGAAEPHVERVVVTHHGPIISEVEDCGGQRIAVNSIALKTSKTLCGWMMLNQAESWDDFVRAVQLIETPQLNIAYADTEGNIGHWVSGKVPVRASGDGMVPVPGWTGEYEWIGEVPFEEMPHALNPEQGYVVSCNQRIVPEDYPYFLGNSFLNGYRAKRVTAGLEGKENLSVKDFRSIQLDWHSIPGKKFAERIQKLQSGDPDIQMVRNRLSAWDGRIAPESVPAALYEVSSYIFLGKLFKPKLGAELTDNLLGKGFHPVLQGASEFLGHNTDIMLRMIENPDSWWLVRAGGLEKVLLQSLKEAVDWLRKELGKDVKEWKWGKIHYLTLDHAMGMKKPLDRVFNRGPFPMGGDTDTPFQTGISADRPYHGIVAAPSHRQIIDLGDFSKSLMIHPPGQSGQLGSPHYDDFLKLWLAGDYHPMLWIRKEIENAAEGKLILSYRRFHPQPN